MWKSVVRVRLIRTGFRSRLLGLPALVFVDELRQIGCFLRKAHNELVFEQLFGCRSLRGKTERNRHHDRSYETNPHCCCVIQQSLQDFKMTNFVVSFSNICSQFYATSIIVFRLKYINIYSSLFFMNYLTSGNIDLYNLYKGNTEKIYSLPINPAASYIKMKTIVWKVFHVVCLIWQLMEIMQRMHAYVCVRERKTQRSTLMTTDAYIL